MIQARQIAKLRWYTTIAVLAVFILTAGGVVSAVYAENDDRSGSSAITIHADGGREVVTTDADTVGEVLERAGIELEDKDRVEPSLDTEIANDTFNITVHRARPLIVEDEDGSRYKVRTAHQSERRIAEEAVEVYEEDKFEIDLVTDFVGAEYVGRKVVINRATPVNLTIGNEEMVKRTHAGTLAGLLKELDIELGEDDEIKPSTDTSITEGMDIQLTHTSVETVEVTETIAPPVEEIKDNDRPVGYEDVKEPGSPGRAIVTYEIEYENSQEVSRTELHRAVEEEPKKRVVVVGSKLNTSGAVWDQLAQCETGGNWSTNTGNGYYGGIQFDEQTWNSWGGQEFASFAHQASRSEQITVAERVRDGYAGHVGRGYDPWPSCADQLGLR